MDKPRNKFRVVGQRRDKLDIERFADAIITFALHRLYADSESLGQPDNAPAERDAEPSR